MIKKKLNSNQLIFLIITFVLGSSIIIGVGSEAKQNAWLSIILATAFSIPLVFIYARIIKLFPDKNIYDILEILFGKIVGKILMVIYIWYSIHLGSLVLCNFTNYIQITTLLETPESIVSILILTVSIFIVKSHITTFGKWGIVVLSMIIFMFSMTIIISISKLQYSYILPILNNDIKNIISSGINTLAFPFAETVIFLGIADFFKKGDNPYKIYSLGITFGGLIILLVFLRNLLVLGIDIATNVYFPSYVTARIIELGEFLPRIEGFITINFILAGITKITVCMISAAKGIAKLFNIPKYNDLATPVGLIVFAICSVLYANIMEMYGFIKVYTIYAVPFQLVIPITIWIVSEVKNKKQNKKN